MPQPIDMQTELARAIIAERVQDATGRASLAAQQRALVDADENRVNAETQVQETEETENKRVEGEARRENPLTGRKKRRRSKKKGEDESSQVFYTADEHKEIAEDPDDHQFDFTV